MPTPAFPSADAGRDGLSVLGMGPKAGRARKIGRTAIWPVFDYSMGSFEGQERTHVDTKPGDAAKYSRIYGYVASLGPTPSVNTHTGFRIEIVFKMQYL